MLMSIPSAERHPAGTNPDLQGLETFIWRYGRLSLQLAANASGRNRPHEKKDKTSSSVDKWVGKNEKISVKNL